MLQKLPCNGLKIEKNYSVKKKPHTFKVQAMIYYKTQQLLSLCANRGTVNNFKRFKRNLQQIPCRVFIFADKVYQGIYKVYSKHLLPVKTKRRCKLNAVLKHYQQGNQ
ncbi:transposase [Acinetobacter sp. ANC 3781]|jgi:hypothetical protein|nr:transposase [Acinetobacter sp. ANC 3781]